MTAPAAFVIHGLPHLHAALAAGAAFGRPIVAVSAPAASGFAGTGWFIALTRIGQAEFPDVDLTAILDCGDRAGDALAALKEGMRHLIFTGHPDAAARLTAIAAETGATILDHRPDALDLMSVKDIEYAINDWCRRLPPVKALVIERQHNFPG